MRPGFFAVLALALTLCLSRALAAAEPSTIALARTPGDERVMQRVRAELAALGYQVVDAAGSELIPLADLGRNARAFIALRVAASGTDFELWIGDPVTFDTQFEERILARDLANDEVRALRAVEVLRARLVKLEIERPRSAALRSEPPSAPPPPLQPAVPARDRDEKPLANLWLAFGPAVSFSPGGVGVLGHVYAALRYKPGMPLALNALALLPLTSGDVTSPEGRIAVRPMLIGGALDYFPLDGRFKLSIGAGGALALVAMHGEPSGGFVGEKDSVNTAVWLLRLGFQGDLTRWLRAGTELMFGASAPRVAIQSLHRDVATWGRPLGIAALVLEVGP